MSWLTDLPLLITRLTEIAGLLREQNSLLREQLLAQTGKLPRTPHLHPPSRPRVDRLRTDKDVFVATAEARAQYAADEARKQTRQVEQQQPLAGGDPALDANPMIR